MVAVPFAATEVRLKKGQRQSWFAEQVCSLSRSKLLGCSGQRYVEHKEKHCLLFSFLGITFIQVVLNPAAVLCVTAAAVKIIRIFYLIHVLRILFGTKMLG